MFNNKIINLADPTDDKDATNKAYVDTNFLKLSGGHITGIVSKGTQSTAFSKSLLNYEEMKFWPVEKGNPYVNDQFIIANQKIINLGDPTDNTDAVNKQFLEQSHIKPTPKTDQFKYHMQNKLEWTDQYGSSFNMVKIAGPGCSKLG